MAVHKIPQDIEADDKFLGPLSFKQFVFAGIALVTGYLTFLLATGPLWIFSIIFFIPTILLGFLAFPWSKEQPTELWLASRIRFLIKPHRRIWDQAGVKHLVEITVPKREQRVYSDGLGQTEVRSRFNALATMVDSRGWAIKHANAPAQDQSDRLIDGTINSASTSVVMPEAADIPDIMDESESTIAKQFDSMIDNSTKQHKSAALELVERARQENNLQPQNTQANEPSQNQTESSNTTHKSKQKTEKGTNEQDFWFLNNQSAPTDPSLATFQSSTVVQPGASTQQQTQQNGQTQSNDNTVLDEQALLEQAHKKHEQDRLQTGAHHEKVIDPNGQNEATVAQPKPQQKVPVNTPVNPDILNLATSNDLNIETLARQANKKDDDNEVVISLR